LPGDLAARQMIYFFRRAGDTRTCETRFAPKGLGYELVVTEGRRSHVEVFKDPQAMADRQSELRYDWLVRGWRDATPPDEIEDDE